MPASAIRAAVATWTEFSDGGYGMVLSD
jgi:hypothetical protein